MTAPPVAARPMPLLQRASHTVDRDWPNAAASRHVEAAGVQWHVQRMGVGPTLLLVHGTGAATHSWRDLAPLLARDFDVIAPDLPGHGFSAALAPRDMNLCALAQRLSALLDALGARPVLAVGHSAGAAIALRMVLDGRLPVRGVVGLNAALLPFGGVLQRVFAPLAHVLAVSGVAPWLLTRRARDRRAVLRVLDSTGSSIDERGIVCYQRLLTMRSHIEATLAMMAHWDLAPLLRELATLPCALHLVVGLADRAVAPAEAERIAARLPTSVVTRIAGAGHLLHEEQPERVAELITNYWQSFGEARVAG